jgi:bacterioferritin
VDYHGRFNVSEKVIKMLNDARARELHAISQYMIQHYELEDADYGKLGDKLKDVAIAEMKHAEELAERILFLNGTPATKPSAEAKKGMDIPAMLKLDIGLEADAVKMYNEFANACSKEGDNVSKSIFEKLLADEEEHLDEFQNILDHIEKLGNVYLASLTE